jgi:hypothetical protein
MKEEGMVTGNSLAASSPPIRKRGAELGGDLAPGANTMTLLLHKTISLVAVFSALYSTAAIAENWVKTPPNSTGMTAMYDADSVYLKASTRIIYVTTCGDVTCTTRNPSELFGPESDRVNCADKTLSHLQDGDWSIPSRPSKEEYALKDNEYAPGTDAAMIVNTMCARESSWPRHQ